MLDATPVSHPRRWSILALVLAAECMDLLDGTIVNVAAPTIRADLHASTAALQWVIGGYAPWPSPSAWSPADDPSAPGHPTASSRWTARGLR